MGLDLFVCGECEQAYTEYERLICQCGQKVCEHCIEQNPEFFGARDAFGYYQQCSSCAYPKLDTNEFIAFLCNKLSNSREELEAEFEKGVESDAE